MSFLTYIQFMYFRDEKPLAWLSSEIKTPPFSVDARIEAIIDICKIRLRDYDETG